MAGLEHHDIAAAGLDEATARRARILQCLLQSGERAPFGALVAVRTGSGIDPEDLAAVDVEDGNPANGYTTRPTVCVD